MRGTCEACDHVFEVDEAEMLVVDDTNIEEHEAMFSNFEEGDTIYVVFCPECNFPNEL